MRGVVAKHAYTIQHRLQAVEPYAIEHHQQKGVKQFFFIEWGNFRH
jgi:hypothetical protein